MILNEALSREKCAFKCRFQPCSLAHSVPSSEDLGRKSIFHPNPQTLPNTFKIVPSFTSCLCHAALLCLSEGKAALCSSRMDSLSLSIIYNTSNLYTVWNWCCRETLALLPCNCCSTQAKDWLLFGWSCSFSLKAFFGKRCLQELKHRGVISCASRPWQSSWSGDLSLWDISQGCVPGHGCMFCLLSAGNRKNSSEKALDYLPRFRRWGCSGAGQKNIDPN